MDNSLVSSAERQAALQQRMRLQRTLISRQLQPLEPVAQRLPRSLTMQFLRRHPGLASQLLNQGITLLVGGRMLRTVSLALLLGCAVRGLAHQRK